MGKAGSSVVVVAVGIALFVSSSQAQVDAPRATITVTPLSLAEWQPTTDNLVVVHGRVAIGGSPVAGVRLRVDGYELNAATDAHGQFQCLVDATRLARHIITVADATHATRGGVPLTGAARSALNVSRGGIDVGYQIHGLHVSVNPSGQPTLEGRLANSAGARPPTVVLYSYQLAGRVTDARGRPVAGARVSTRTVDRDYWTVSAPTGADGSYESLFTASSEQGGNPVPITLRVSLGDLVYEYLSGEYVSFQRLRSARLDIRLPPRGYPIALPVPRTYPGANYEGVVVGAAVGGKVLRPVTVTWPDGSGRFKLVLPRSLAGQTVSLWEANARLYSRTAPHAGGPIALGGWPTALPEDAPRNLVQVRLR
jgi:hypothetical protein